MIGNVWEHTKSNIIANVLLPFLIFLLIAVILLIISLGNLNIIAFLFVEVLTVSLSIYSVTSTSMRGGAWNTPCEKATCFYRTFASEPKFAGFRCLKEL